MNIKTLISRWLITNKAILVNTGSLIGTWGVTSGLGFVYWWLAARTFAPQEVGIGSASLSVMTLLGTVCMLGLGTLLITELPRKPELAGPLISTALIVVGIVGIGVGAGFALIAPLVSVSFAPLRTSTGTLCLFALGVGLTSITLVLDQALIGLLQGTVQLWRNFLFALGKLIALFFISRWLAQTSGIGIYAAWAIGNMLSLLVLTGLVVRKQGLDVSKYRPEWSLLRQMGGTALQHHLLNLVLATPTLLLPVIVTVMLSARANAWFYVAWMVANFVFVVPGALTVVLHAVNSAQQAALQQRARMTLSLASGISAAAIMVLLFGAKLVLSFFGSSYAAQAAWTLQILALGALPLVIKNHYIAICRIKDRILPALAGMTAGGLLELGAAAIGAHLAGLVGLAIGWVIAMLVESIFMSPVIAHVIFPGTSRRSSQVALDGVWLIDTALLPAMGRGYTGTEPVWLINSALQPAIGYGDAAAKSAWLKETTRLPAVRPPALKKTRLESLHQHTRLSLTNQQGERNITDTARPVQSTAADLWSEQTFARSPSHDSTMYEDSVR